MGKVYRGGCFLFRMSFADQLMHNGPMIEDAAAALLRDMCDSS